MAAAALLYGLHTLFLFTKSDMKTLIPPVWVHTLQLGLANQTRTLLITPIRPIPAGRISIQTARTLRWAMIPFCLLLSAAYGPRTTLVSLGASLFMLTYNEGGGACGHWFSRNALNAIGYALAEAGATLVACRDEREADGITCNAIALSAGIILTTIHTQDYKDMLGDAAIGRVTLPIAYPHQSRVATTLFLIAWSWGVSRLWHLDDFTACGLSFLARTDARADKVSFYGYNVWLCAVYTLPRYYRLRLVS
ncbi:hypothetical protein F5148DRAFT_1274980 [Russula earlei]|uniref:Uncharacterized protein n=1 Tax=Russula earlei TaxID=71964 RepID=A0ACC0UFB1_9AGAM|nr:hypothetical protein F5148DRAFT_1274980 [Russula earlei]